MVNWHSFCIAKAIIESETRAGFVGNVEGLFERRLFPALK